LSTSNPGQEVANGSLCSTKLLSKSESQIERLSFVMNSPCQCAHNPPTHTRIFLFSLSPFLIFLSLSLAPAHTVSPSLFLSLSLPLSLSLSLSLSHLPHTTRSPSLLHSLSLPCIFSFFLSLLSQANTTVNHKPRWFYSTLKTSLKTHKVTKLIPLTSSYINFLHK